MADIKETESKIIWDSKENPAYSEDGVDLTLIRWMLSLTPTERLKVLQQNIISISRMKNAGTRMQDSGNP